MLTAQPFSRWLETEMLKLKSGYAELGLPLREEFNQQHGRPHGGVISYMADNALTFAGGSLFGDGLTLEYKINYLKAAQGTRLIARAEVENAGEPVAVCSCRLFAVDAEGTETLFALAQGTIMAPAEAD